MISPRNTLNNAFEICQPVAGKSSPTAAQEASRIVLSEKCQNTVWRIGRPVAGGFRKAFSSKLASLSVVTGTQVLEERLKLYGRMLEEGKT